MHFAFLGTSGSVPSAVRDTTSLVFVVPQGAILIDCGGSPIQKLRRAGVDPNALAVVVITHIHPDHAYGLPALIRNLSVLGRQAPLTIYCRPGDVAARAGVRRLILAHIGAEYHAEIEALADEARARFAGEVEIARELVPYPL